MNRLLRRRLEMAARVCEFLRTHQKQEEGEEPALVRLEQLIERANALQFRLPSSGSHQAFLTAARGMLQTATAQKELLVKEGMKASVLDDLSTALLDFEKTLETSRVGRRLHTGASAELHAIAAEIVERVRLLDGLVRYRFGDDVQLMGAWASARNVLGPFRPRSQPAAPEGQTPAGEGPNAARPAA